MSILWLHPCVLLGIISYWVLQVHGQCEVGSTKLSGVLPPERLCVALIQRGNNIRLQLSWTEARICSPIGTVGYLVRYKDIHMTEDTTILMVNGLLLDISTRDFTSNTMYYFQVASIVSQTSGEIMSPYSHCVKVTIIENTLPEQCQTAIYECDEIQTVTTNGIIQPMGTDNQSTTTDSAAIQLDTSRPTKDAAIAIPVVLLFLILLASGLILFVYFVRRKRKMRMYAIQPTKQASATSCSTYNLTAVNQNNSRFAITSEDRFENSTIRRMSMRSSVFEKRTHMKLAKPQITSVSNEVRTMIGEQVTLRLNFSGTPQPTLVWTFKGRPLGVDPSVELSADGSLVIVCVEQRHAGRYGIEISNTVGSTKGHIDLIVHQSPDEHHNNVNREKNALESAQIKTKTVIIDKFGDYVTRLHTLNNKEFISQFQALPICESGRSFLVGRTGSNQQLNRFENITAYDHNRVVLSSMAEYSGTQNEYINASFIDGFARAKKYIATQGPLPETVVDFWHMVWQEKVSSIAMVTNTTERGIKKCELYWPEVLQEEKKIGPFKITLSTQQIFADYTVRYMELEKLREDNPPWKVVQYHYTSWPDHGVPEYAGPVLLFLKHINANHTKDKGPLLVHCSAGVGRTGTLIGIDMILAQASTEGIIDVPAVITKMREQRMKMVQTTDQYMLIHDAVLEFLICGNTRVVASTFNVAMDSLNKYDKQTGKIGYETQFEVLDQVSPKPDEVLCTAALQNQQRNRSDKYLPPDNWRVFLMREVPNYINASFVNGYRVRKGFIIAQSPTSDTIREFWHMIFDRKCNVVVMLANIQEEGTEVCAQYWPQEVSSSQHFNEIAVTTESEETKKGYTERVISVLETKSGNKHKVTQYQVGHWTAEGLNSQPKTIIEIINDIIVVQRRSGNRAIVVHGCNTVSRSCIFCAVVNAIEFCKMESVIDIFEVVKAIRIQKPGAIQTVEQYKFIYDLMLYFLDEYSDYSNFK